MLPSYKQFMHPFLEMAKTAYLSPEQSNEIKLRDVINQCADHFHLTPEEREK